jgi:Uma2 family endonuclease
MGTVTTPPWGRELTEKDLVGRPFGDAHVELVDGSLVVTRPGGYSGADLWDFPDDGHRYELLDGAVLVTPSPSRLHQRMSGGLLVTLRAGCPPGLEVLTAPLDVPLAVDTTLEPDLLVVDRDDQHGHRQLPRAPLLVVEILSPTTRRFDLRDKKDRYERAGVPSYWVLDPTEPGRLQVWELRDGAYVQVSDVSGETPWTAEVPYPVTVRPSDLLS